MSERADRYRRIAGRFTETVSAVPDGAGNAPRHVFFHTWDLARATGLDET